MFTISLFLICFCVFIRRVSTFVVAAARIIRARESAKYSNTTIEWGKNASKWILYFTVCYVFFAVIASLLGLGILAHELEFFIQLKSVVGGRSFASCRHSIFKFETVTNRLQC